MLRVVLTGPECSGKTTLVKKLAEYFKVPFVEEFAVHYLELKPKYTYADLDQIAIGQVYSETDGISNLINSGGKQILLCDTDVLTIKIWSEVVFKKTSREVNSRFKKTFILNESNAVYLLCSPEGIHWEFHPQRENPNDRDKLFERYEELLKKLNLPYYVLRGNVEVRFNEAVKIIEIIEKNAMLY